MWKRANPERVRASVARQDPARDRAIHAAWRAAHPEAMRVIQSRDRAKNAEARRIYGAEYRRRPEVRTIRMAKNREWKACRKIAGTHSEADWLRTLNRFGGRCAYCPDPATTRDHIMPISRGGSNYIGNIHPACARCNSSKGAKLLVEWRR